MKGRRSPEIAFLPPATVVRAMVARLPRGAVRRTRLRKHAVARRRALASLGVRGQRGAMWRRRKAKIWLRSLEGLFHRPTAEQVASWTDERLRDWLTRDGLLDPATRSMAKRELARRKALAGQVRCMLTLSSAVLAMVIAALIIVVG